MVSTVRAAGYHPGNSSDTTHVIRRARASVDCERCIRGWNGRNFGTRANMQSSHDLGPCLAAMRLVSELSCSSTGESAGVDPNATASCEVGVLRCDGNVRERCNAVRHWVPLSSAEQCASRTPACVGAGECLALRLRSGGLTALGGTGRSSARYTLRSQTLSAAPAQCNADYCASGSISP